VHSASRLFSGDRFHSAQIVVFRNRLVAVLQFTSSFVVFDALTVTIAPKDFASAHVVIAVAASERISVLAGFLRLIHGNISRVEDMGGGCVLDMNHTSA